MFPTVNEYPQEAMVRESKDAEQGDMVSDVAKESQEAHWRGLGLILDLFNLKAVACQAPSHIGKVWGVWGVFVAAGLDGQLGFEAPDCS